MRTDPNATTATAVAISWLASVSAVGTAFVLAVVGQGLGAMAGGCGWIGAALPMNRQVWALVNQPVLNFSSLPGAGGYWLGSMILPLFAATFLLSLRTRKPTLVGQLTLVQTAWWAALVAGVWLPLLDPGDGHLTRWLMVHRFPLSLVWSMPVAATVVAVWVGFRVLEIVRWHCRDPNRWARLAIVVVQLFLPVAVWLVAIVLVCGHPPLRPVLGLLMPGTAVAVFAFFRYPPPYPRPPAPPSPAGVVSLAAAALIAASVLWLAGRPLTDNRVSGVLWSAPESFNNIRQWIEPKALTERARIHETE